MKKYKFTLYGALVGVISAVFGSVLFSLIIVPILPRNSHIGTLFQFFCIISLYSSILSALPGAIGGAYLSHWSERTDRDPRETTRHGLLVGVLAGTIVAIAFIGIMSMFYVDSFTVGLAILAIVVAAGMSLLTVKWLARKKRKFVVREPLLK
jgi:peptidoglycan/LPS O-acetylase OafA/YrhL